MPSLLPGFYSRVMGTTITDLLSEEHLLMPA
jgi:hypothetical protein